MFELLLFLLGALAGLLAGTVGLGGGIVLAPLLIYAPVWLGHPQLSMAEVTGLTMVNSLCSTCAAGLAHGRRGSICWSLVLWMGSVIFASGLAGAWISQHLPSQEHVLRALFAVLAVGAAGLMFLPVPKRTDSPHDGPPNRFSKPLAVAAATAIGSLGGIVGQTGAFLTIPALVYLLRTPMRTAIGSGLAITFCAAVGGTIGKQAAGQVDWYMVWPLVIGSVTAGPIGAYVSHRVPTSWLRRILAVLIIAAAVRIAYDVLSRL